MLLPFTIAQNFHMQSHKNKQFFFEKLFMNFLLELQLMLNIKHSLFWTKVMSSDKYTWKAWTGIYISTIHSSKYFSPTYPRENFKTLFQNLLSGMYYCLIFQTKSVCNTCSPITNFQVKKLSWFLCKYHISLTLSIFHFHTTPLKIRN